MQHVGFGFALRVWPPCQSQLEQAGVFTLEKRVPAAWEAGLGPGNLHLPG